MPSRQPFVVDANRCIAYHTIENRAEALLSWIEPHLNGWIAGCDICQDICPCNQSFAQATNVADFYPRPENVAPQLSELAEISDREWDRCFRGSALRRIKPPMLRRNALPTSAASKRARPPSRSSNSRMAPSISAPSEAASGLPKQRGPPR